MLRTRSPNQCILYGSDALRPCASQERASCRAAMIIGSYAAISGSLSDAQGSSAVVAAIAWLEGTLLGNLATTIAVIAVSWVGMLMLMGRLEICRGLTTIAGCFVLFGASSIAAGISSSVNGSQMAINYVPASVASPPLMLPLRRHPDPYAGASVPR